jgi:hypothetical protein
MENGITKAHLKSALSELKDDLMAEMRQIETNLLTEFRLLHLESRRPPTV